MIHSLLSILKLMCIFVTSVGCQLSARTNYWLIFTSPTIPHYTCTVVTTALLGDSVIGNCCLWSYSLFLILLQVGRLLCIKSVCSCYLAIRNASVLKLVSFCMFRTAHGCCVFKWTGKWRRSLLSIKFLQVKSTDIINVWSGHHIN